MKNYNETSVDIKLDVPFTVVVIKALDTGLETIITVMDEKCSKNGVLVKTEELPSFKGECAVVYKEMVNFYIDLSKKLDEQIRKVSSHG